ncbi:hypothetical protein ATCC90586_006127 [Pythium insidiosum]|nr:hypothetical protein ATCC90586_006127 [Pythium insidiosum]
MSTTTPTGAALSPSTMSKLPGLHFAINHRRGDLRLPSLSSFEEDTASESAMRCHPADLRLSMTQCETPHFLPGVPTCPETSPAEKHSSNASSTCEGRSGHDPSSEANKKRKKGTRRGTLNAEAKNVLKAWMFSPEHFAHPYPSEEEKEELASEAGIEVKQLSNWFTNARKRLWQPVLRQSGVEVKNFLSTGRGGPRGNKLDVPPNVQFLIAQRSTPPASPGPATDYSASSTTSNSNETLKRTWAEMHSSPAPSSMPMPSMVIDEAPLKKKKTLASRKRAKDARSDDDAPTTKTAAQLSQELRLALAGRSAAIATAPPGTKSPVVRVPPSVAAFQELEILAAASLIGLHQQQYQRVH